MHIRLHVQLKSGISFYFLKAFFIRMTEWLFIRMTDNSFAEYLFFFVCKYILYPFIIQQEMLKWDEKRKDVPSLQPHCTFLHICVLKMSCRKCRKWYFGDPKFKHFQGVCSPPPPRDPTCLENFLCSNFSSLAETFQISHLAREIVSISSWQVSQLSCCEFTGFALMIYW